MRHLETMARPRQPTPGESVKDREAAGGRERSETQREERMENNLLLMLHQLLTITDIVGRAVALQT